MNMDGKAQKPHKGGTKKKGGFVERHNPKAFSFSGGHISVRRRVQRSAEVEQKKQKHVVAIDKAIHSQLPPFIVVVQGPPGCGKTTLIRSLVKYYCHQSVGEINGPISVVASKSRRLTFVEVSHEAGNMLDLGKVADLAIVMIDSRKGFEKDTMEFINVLKVHGMPRILGVLTFLDDFKEAKSTQKLKKKLKKRFWTELYDGAKLFYLSGMKDRQYLSRDVVNLSRFISVQKFEPLIWQSNHPYMLALNVDITSQDEETSTVEFTGYIKGTYLRSNQRFCIPGCGSFPFDNIQRLTDPLPLPTNKNPETKDGAKNLRKLRDGSRHVYAPLSDVGALEFEGRNMYLKIFEKPVESESEEEVISENEEPNSSGSDTDWSVSDSDELVEDSNLTEQEVQLSEAEDSVKEATPKSNWDAHNDATVWSDSDASFSDVDAVEFEKDDFQSVSELIACQQDNHGTPYHALVYEADSTAYILEHSHPRESARAATLDEFLHDSDHAQAVSDLMDATYWPDRSRAGFLAPFIELAEKTSYLDEDSEDQTVALTIMEDVKFTVNTLKCIRSLSFATGGWDSGLADESRDALISALNTTKQPELDTIEIADAIPVGTFIKLRIAGISNEWVSNLSAVKGISHPVVLGGIKQNENALSFLTCKVIKHRWARGIMKSSEPLLFSVGWQRFQSLPYFAMEDRNESRIRYLKYTPEHLHCLMYFNGFVAPPGTGVLAMKYHDRKNIDWRISLTGSVSDVNMAPKVMKKIKFLGDVSSIKVHTAFVKNMFNSSLEVNRSIGAKIKTQSGIRGIIKKAKGDDGEFRATFEAKIRKNDIIICPAWVPIPMEPFCNPMVDVKNWDRLRTFAEIRRELQIPMNQAKIRQSAYKPKEKVNKYKFNKLNIPTDLVNSLPFKSIPKTQLAHSIDERTEKDVPKSAYDKMIETLVSKSRHAEKQLISKNKANLAKKHEIRSKQTKHNLTYAHKAEADDPKSLKRHHFAVKGFNEKQARKRLRLTE